MLLSKKQLIGLPVITKDSQYLGRVKDFKLDPLTSVIVKYVVSSSHLVEKILSKDLMIDKAQVISINENEMIVDSAAIQEGTTTPELAST